MLQKWKKQNNSSITKWLFEAEHWFCFVLFFCWLYAPQHQLYLIHFPLASNSEIKKTVLDSGSLRDFKTDLVPHVYHFPSLVPHRNKKKTASTPYTELIVFSKLTYTGLVKGLAVCMVHLPSKSLMSCHRRG